MLTHSGSFQKEKRLQENWAVFPINFPFADEGHALEREGLSLDGEQCLRAPFAECPLQHLRLCPGQLCVLAPCTQLRPLITTKR